MMRTTTTRSVTVLAACAVLLPVLLAGSGNAAMPTFGKALRLGAGSEPEITIGADGATYVDAPTGTPGHSALWRQDASGGSFKSLSFTAPYNRFPGGGDSAIAISAGNSQRVYFLDLWLGSDSLTISNDAGATWSSGTPVTSLPPSDRQWIATGKTDPVTHNDTVYIAYHQVPTGVLQFMRSTDSGATWTTYGFIPGALPQQTPTSNPLIADGDFIATNYVSGGQMVVAISTDAGSTWKTTKASFLKNLFLGSIENMARDGNDLWLAYLDNQYQVQVIHSPDLGTSWERGGFGSQLTDGHANMFPWIAARNGKVAISWYGAPTASGDPNTVSAQWFVMYSEFTGHDEFGNMTFTDPVKATGAVKSGGICTMGVQCTKDRELGDYQSIAIDGNGKSVIAYVNGTTVNVVKQD